MRLFFDANVLFTAAHNPKGKAAFIIELEVQGHWELFSSPYALKEASRNLERKFPESSSELAHLLRSFQLIEHRPGLDYPESLIEKDQPIFQAALACQATHLLTGDLKDFGPFMNRPEDTFGVCIQTVAEFLNQLS
jgi:predicted nucleic acid-binding protein